MKYVYIRVEVLPASPEQILLNNSLQEKINQNILPDIIPHTDPSSILFKHAFVEADDIDDAYLFGYRELSKPQIGSVCNDYVVLIK